MLSAKQGRTSPTNTTSTKNNDSFLSIISRFPRSSEKNSLSLICLAPLSLSDIPSLIYFYLTWGDPLINSVCRDATYIPTLIYIYLIGRGVWDFFIPKNIVL